MGHGCSPTDWMQAVCSVIMAAMSLAIAAAVCAISWKATEFVAATNALTAAAQQLAAAGRKPFLLVHIVSNHLGIRISLKNQGGGPALATAATYSLKHSTVHDTAASRNAHPGKFYGLLDLDSIQRTGQDADAGLAGVLNLSDASANHTCKHVAGEVIGAGCELVLLACKVQDTPAGKLFLSEVHNALDSGLVQVAYTEALSPSKNEAPAVASKLLSFGSSWSDDSGECADDKISAAAFSSTTGSWRLRDVSES